MPVGTVPIWPDVPAEANAKLATQLEPFVTLSETAGIETLVPLLLVLGVAKVPMLPTLR